MKITRIGHSGFLVSLADYNLIFDFYTDKAGVITPETFEGKKTIVFVSHKHADHYNKEIFEWEGDISYVLDTDCEAPARANITKMREGETAWLYEGAVRLRAYGSTDEGLSFLVNIGGVVLFHAGDLNDWYWADEFPAERLRDAEEAYLRIIRQLAAYSIDVAFVPKDPRLGEHESRAVDFFQEIVQPGMIVPMHFEGDDGAEVAVD